ncbi:Protein CBG13830 [Caenorhabditis briggsae]|uniref:Protein CBG13830 n=1 Tax=Caenorhabditis briggsae TaxID=6238 RepID=A8XIT0_CAEBR|nr:Protein CBG13830 [Caenorhabditis briggsae]CAP32555.2 Protein CBG13830 [Caenorhabditis briggsae]
MYKAAQLSNPWFNGTAVAIAHNSPQFCLALREAKIFLNYEKVSSFMFDSKVCKPGKQAKKACIVPKVGCVNFVGNLRIGPKFNFKKVKNLKFIYGSLIVKNSSLTDFKVFENLLEIVQLNSTKLAIDVQGNKNLQSATFPKLKRIYSANTVGVLFKNNHNSLKFDSKSCISIRSAMLRAGPVCTCSPIFDDLKCEEMEQWKKQTGRK